jgi:radical SAM superfamily enzyme YgiQ (UPF0313 family)
LVKVVLIDLPPSNFTRIYWCEATSSANTKLPPLDLLYISSFLEKFGIETEVKDTNYICVDAKYFVFHIVYQSLQQDLEYIHMYQKFGKTIVFGCDVTARPDFYRKFDCIDYVVTGEPELPILAIVEKKKFYSYVLENLDGLLPNYEKTDLKKYSCSYIKKKPFVVSLSSRGCSYRCSFCSSHLMFGRKFRQRSPFDIVNEMYYFSKKGVKTIWYYDDTFTLSRKRVLKICEMIKKYNPDVYWKTQTRADKLDEEMISKMLEAGCYELGIGIESGNQVILNKNHKNLNLRKTEETFSICNDLGMRTVAFFMLGMAYETKKTVQETIDFAKKINPTYAQFVLATPYRGTEFYNLAKKEGWLVSNNYDCSGKYILKMNDLTPEYMEQKLTEAKKQFYLRPRYVLRQLKSPSVEKIKSFLGVIK